MMRAIKVLYNKSEEDAEESNENPKIIPSTVTESTKITPNWVLVDRQRREEAWGKEEEGT